MNLLPFKYTNVTVFEVAETIWPIARLLSPLINSPTITLVFKLNPETKVSESKTGVAVVFDSKTPITFPTSGTFKDISSSSILNP